MSKYKVGDKVLLEAEVLNVNSDSNVIFPYYLGLKNDASYHCAEKDIECISKTYEDGLNDAWELARKICGDGSNEGNYDAKTVCEIFGGYTFAGLVLDTFTYQQALAKVAAHEENRAIKVGDVVEHFGKPVVVTRVSECGTVVDGFGMGGFAKSYRVCECTKTGRHIDIEHLLEQVRGNE